MLSRFFVFGVVAFFVVGCEFKDDGGKPKSLGLTPFSQSDVRAVLVPQGAANVYSIEITWPKVNDFVFLRLKSDDDYTQIDSGKTVHKFQVQGGKEYEVHFERRDQGGATLSFQSFKFDVPKDFVVDGTLTLNQNRQVICGRFFLQSGSVLQIQNFKLDLICDEFISDSGAIETFPANLVAATKGANGRSGGEANLKFRKASGIVYVNLRGESGADGRNGIHGFDTRKGPFAGCRGQNGGAGGATGSFYLKIDEPTKLERVVTFIPGNGGRPGHSVAAFEDREAIRLPNTPGYPETHDVCDTNGGSGNQGAAGAKGVSCFEVSGSVPECK